MVILMTIFHIGRTNSEGKLQRKPLELSWDVGMQERGKKNSEGTCQIL